MTTPQAIFVGVFSVEGEPMFDHAPDGFVYSTNLDTNLWCSRTASDGGRLGFDFVSMGLGALVDDGNADNEGATTEITTEAGVVLRWTIGEIIDHREYEAFQVISTRVRIVRIEVQP